MNGAHPMDASEASDVEETDVKVCDICGDAGREDQLAICSRCSDGAEHTYCMREMLEDLPEDNWLCEECRFDEELKTKRHDNNIRIYGNEKSCSSEQASAVNSSLRLKSEAVSSDDEGNRLNKDHSRAKVSGKSHMEDSEVSSVAKKQALEPAIGSPKKPSPSRTLALHRDISFKNFDGAKVKSAHQSSSGVPSNSDTLDSDSFPVSGHQLQSPRGTFLKSNSFNSLNVKPKVKLVDEVFPLKRKSVKDAAVTDSQEAPTRSIGKSVSFNSTNSGRVNANEPKVKMLSPRLVHAQDSRRFKHVKERNLFERKNSFRSEGISSNSGVVNSTFSTSRTIQKLASRDETSLLSPRNSNDETMVIQLDSRSLTSSKLSDIVTSRDSDIPIPSGEVRRQSSCSVNIGVSSNKTSISELQPSQVNTKDNSLPNSVTAEGPHLANGSLGLSRSKDVKDFSERMRESSGSHAKQTSTSGRSESPVLDASAAKTSGFGISPLKAAIEAARLIKPGLIRNRKPAEQNHDASVSSPITDMNSQDQLSNSSKRNMPSVEEAQRGNMFLQSSASAYTKQVTSNNVKPFAALPVEVPVSEAGNAAPAVLSEGKNSVKDIPASFTALTTLLAETAVPEHELIWQGSFEVQRSGKTVGTCDGVQAHLSTCASPKVTAAVNKLPRKILLHEVPRLSTWPIQFHECSVSEDNIALFFFAKDLFSYEKSYKILLDSMMKGDLALKGDHNGVELLIFPSNHLPRKSQRWNMLFFLWGVFREKKVNCLQQLSHSEKQFHVPQNTPAAVMSLPESICSVRSLDKDLANCGGLDTVSGLPTSGPVSNLSSSEKVNAVCGTESTFEGHNGASLPIMTQSKVDAISPSIMQCSQVNLQQEIRHSAVVIEREILDKPSSRNNNKLSSGTTLEDVSLQGSALERDPKMEELSGLSLNGRTDQNADYGERFLPTASFGLDLEIPSTDLDMTVEATRESVNTNAHRDGSCEYDDSNSSSGGTVSREPVMSSGCPLVQENGRTEALGDVGAPFCTGNAERYFFPIDPHSTKLIGVVDKSKPWKVHPPAEDPNLELALGAETKPLTHTIPNLLEKTDRKGIQDHHLVKAETREEEESTALALSLAFPFTDGENAGRSASQTEQNIPDRQRASTSLLLFGDLRDK